MRCGPFSARKTLDHTMRRSFIWLAVLALVGCSGRDTGGGSGAPDGSTDGAGAAVDAATMSTADSGQLSGAADAAAALPTLADRGKPGCGFDAAAFCATFDAPAKTHGRAGELDPAWWSASRT